MKTFILITIFIALTLAQNQPGCQNQSYTPVDITLEGYSGRWYEIYTSKNIHELYEKGCACTYAEYGVLNPTTISVNNYCYNVDKQKEQSISGKAKVTGTGSLNVKLFPFQFWESPLQVIQIQGDYEVAIALSCNPYRKVPIAKDIGDQIWILSRKPEITREQELSAFTYLRNHGFLLDTLEKSYQGEQCESHY